MSGVGCDLCLWYSLDVSINYLSIYIPFDFPIDIDSLFVITDSNFVTTESFFVITDPVFVITVLIFVVVTFNYVRIKNM